MLYYSEVTKKAYKTAEECQKAEFEVKQAENLEKIKKERLANERKERATKVENARKALIEAQKAYHKELEAFIKDYGSYHYTETSVDNVPNLFDLFTKLF